MRTPQQAAEKPMPGDRWSQVGYPNELIVQFVDDGQVYCGMYAPGKNYPFSRRRVTRDVFRQQAALPTATFLGGAE